MRYYIFPSLYPLVCRFQNNNDVEMEVVIAKYLSRCDGRGALKIPSFYTHYEVNVNLIRIMFGFWVSPTILNIYMFRMWIVGEQTWQWVQWIQRQLCVSYRHPEVREIEIFRWRQTPSQLQHSIDKMFSSFSDSPRLSLLHFDVTDRFLTSMNQIRAWRGPPSSLS